MHVNPIKPSCYVCGKLISWHNSSGACISCNVKAQHKGIKLEKRPPVRICVKCGVKIYPEQKSKNDYCKPCSVVKGDKHYRKEGMFTGVNGGNYKTGKSLSYGYVRILSPNHPNRNKTTGYILEHRLVVEKYMGRLLKRTENVHHIDGNRLNNNINNLMVFRSMSSHLKYEWGKDFDIKDIIFDGSKL